MKITDLLHKESISLKAAPTNKAECLEMAISLMEKAGNISDYKAYKEQVFFRETEGTTGIGDGIAIPHGKCAAVKQPGLAAMVIPDGVEYEALDGEPVYLLFLIAAPNTKDNVHLDVLAKLSRLLMHDDFVEGLKAAKTPEEFLSICDKYDTEDEDAEKAPAAAAQTDDSAEGKLKILAVTACPTGIAHTYMAAEALEKKGTEMGYNMKVETRGSSGAKNVLTDEDIKEAIGIIVACDTKVPVDRFDGKKVIQVHVADGINKAEELITRIAGGDAPVFHASGEGAGDEASSGGSGESVGQQIYKHLMSGVSHMLPFVIGGGIMTAIAFLLDTLMGHADAGSAFGTATAISAFFKYVGGLAMNLMVPVLAGYIAYSIADRPGLAVGFTGGILASSGNALASSYTWAGTSTGFLGFVEKFAFQGSTGNTVSGFLGGIVAGFLAGYIVLWLKKITSNFPSTLDGIRPTLIYPLCGIFIESVLMCFIFNPIVGAINTGLSVMLQGIGNSGALWALGLILGAMMAIDMGGPINKAAYVFGTAMLAEAAGAPVSDTTMPYYVAMACVMIGGMCPPVGIALATRFFPKKFTKAERDSWVSNLIMGASFITEGAIPFAASDPGHVIPATLVGSAVAGLLAGVFKCTLMAPHGGIFVFATVGHPLLYIVAWAVGSIITCFLLGVLKKDVKE